MCFHSKQSKKAQTLEKRYNAMMAQLEIFQSADSINGFEFPKTPVIASEETGIIQHMNWGLIPHWSKDETIRKYTLNAKIETLKEKPSFKDSINNRCLIIADGFYEWQWLDSRGKNKQKYLISLPDDSLFAFAGIWSNWSNPKTGELKKTYSIITTEANELMAKIHNTKKRMPVILTAENEKDWLGGNDLEAFKQIPIELKAKALNPNSTISLFD